MKRAFCLTFLGIDLPVATVMSLLKEQVDWENKRQMASSKEYLHRRYTFLGESANVDCMFTQELTKEGKKG